MAVITCGTLTQNLGTYPGSGTVDGWCAHVDLSRIAYPSIFWTNVDVEGAYIQIYDSTGTTRYPVHVKNIDTSSHTGSLNVWVPQFITASAVVLLVKLDTSQTAFNPTLTDLSGLLSNNATTNSVTGWTNDTGTLTSRTSSPSPFSGTGYFDSTGAETRAHFTADLDVSAYATEIDAGRCWFRQIIRQAGFGSSDLDRGEVEYQPFDGGGVSLATRRGSGDINLTDQTWRWRMQQCYVPPNTRDIRIFYHAIRSSGVNCDTYMNLWQPTLVTCADAYGPWKVYQDLDGNVDMEHAGVQGYTGFQDSTGNQPGWGLGDPAVWNMIGTTADTDASRGSVYDLYGSSGKWYGVDDAAGTCKLLKGSSIQGMTTLNSNILTDSGVTSPTAAGAPAFYNSQVYFGVVSATQGWVTVWDSSGNFVSKFETTTQTTNVIAVEIIPPNQTGWTTADPRLFVISSGNNSTIWEYTVSGTFVAARTLTFNVGTMRGIRFWKGWLYICSSSASEVYRCNAEYQITSGHAPGDEDLTSQGFFGNTPAAGTYQGIGIGPATVSPSVGVSLYVTVDNGTTEAAEEWQPFAITQMGGGGMFFNDSGVAGLEYAGVRNYSTFAMFCSGDLDNTSSFDRYLMAYWKTSSGTGTGSTVRMGYHLATAKFGIWDTANGWLDSTIQGTSTTRWCGVYRGTTGRDLYRNGGNKVSSPGAITVAPSGKNAILYGTSKGGTSSDVWIGYGGYGFLYPAEPSAHLILLDSDVLNADFWTYAETALNVTSTATIGPTGSVDLDLVESLTSTATIVPTGSVELTAIDSLSTTATIVPTGSVEFDLIESLSTTATIVPTGSIVFGVFGGLELTTTVTVVPLAAYTFFGIGSHPGPLPYTVYVKRIDSDTEVVQPELEVSVGPQDHTVVRLVKTSQRP
jgi:hypothetical protein